MVCLSSSEMNGSPFDLDCKENSKRGKSHPDEIQERKMHIAISRDSIKEPNRYKKSNQNGRSYSRDMEKPQAE